MKELFSVEIRPLNYRYQSQIEKDPFMKVLYIFPHPDDESFGVGQVLHYQSRIGHEVYLLTLTKGGATKQRHKFGFSIEEMGEVRYREMLEVEKVLKLRGMTVLDFVDSGLKESNPIEIEQAILKEIQKIEPEVVVTYAVHGISGFHDHLVSHALVKRVYCQLQAQGEGPKRLAFYTVNEETSKKSKHFPLSYSTDQEIDCVIQVDPEDIEACRRALDCYETFKATIEVSGIKESLPLNVPFEFFQEENPVKATSLFDNL